MIVRLEKSWKAEEVGKVRQMQNRADYEQTYVEALAKRG